MGRTLCVTQKRRLVGWRSIEPAPLSPGWRTWRPFNRAHPAWRISGPSNFIGPDLRAAAPSYGDDGSSSSSLRLRGGERIGELLNEPPITRIAHGDPGFCIVEVDDEGVPSTHGCEPLLRLDGLRKETNVF